MAEIISNDLLRETAKLAQILVANFTPPEFIPGCSVVGTADINEYAANNGWIEAICGHHNQQRVRWKSGDSVGTTDYIDVLYFQDRHLFEAYGVGGTAAIPAPGGGWPFERVITVSSTDADADYTTIQDAIDSVTAGTPTLILLDWETFTEDITINGLSVGITTLNRSMGVGATIGINGTVTITGESYVFMQGIRLSNQTDGAETTTLIVNSGTTLTRVILDSCLLDNGAGTLRNLIDFQDDGVLMLWNVRGEIGTVNSVVFKISSVDTSGRIEIYGGYYFAASKIFTGASANPTVVLYQPPQINLASAILSDFAGTLLGRYSTTTGDIVTLPNTKMILGNGAAEAPLSLTARSAAPSSPGAGDLYLDDGTNTPSGNKNLMHYDGAAWDELGGGAGSGQNFQLYNSGTATEYATLALANAAAASGDTILVYPGTYTADDVTLTDGVNLIVLDPDNTTFSTSTGQYCIRTGAGSYLYGVRATVTTSHATQVGGIFLAGNNSICENCRGVGSNSHASGFGYGFYQISATGVELIDCTGDGTGTTAADNYGYRMDTGTGTCRISSGQYLGDANSVYCDGTSLDLDRPKLNTFDTGAIGGGAITGEYIDSNGQTQMTGAIVTTFSNPVDSIPVLAFNNDNIFQVNTTATSDFVATIATLPGGATLTYNAPSSGSELNLVPATTTQLAKLTLHNTTRGTSALISNCNAGTNTITLTANVPAGWQVGDTITIRSQTNTQTVGGAYFVDFEVISGYTAAIKYIFAYLYILDTGGAGQTLYVHPFEAYSGAKLQIFRTQSTSLYGVTAPIQVTSNKFCVLWTGSGAATVTVSLRSLLEGRSPV